MSSIFGANWQTTLWGGIQSLCLGVVTGTVVFPTNWSDPKQDVLFAAVVILTASGIKFAITAKSREVTGGNVQQSTNGAAITDNRTELVEITQEASGSPHKYNSPIHRTRK